jgi:hypothetical protein
MVTGSLREEIADGEHAFRLNQADPILTPHPAIRPISPGGMSFEMNLQMRDPTTQSI